MRVIRAHSFGGPEVLQLESLPRPVPGSGEVLIDIHAAGVNPADTYMLTGNYAKVPDLPYIPGGDCAGVVAAVGPNVTAFARGDRVFVSAALGGDLSGCYAEAVVRSAKNVLSLPETTSFDQGAALGVPYATAHIALFARGRAKPGETVFIHGASGAVGSAAIQLGRRAGLRMIGSAGTPEGLDRVRAQGAELAVNHAQPGYLEVVRAATGGEGPALIVEMLADANLAADMTLAARYGRVVIVGCRGEVSIAPRIAMMKELDIMGMAIWNAPRELVTSAFCEITEGLHEGVLRPEIGMIFPLAQSAEAHRAVLRPGTRGKTILSIGPNS